MEKKDKWGLSLAFGGMLILTVVLIVSGGCGWLPLNLFPGGDDAPRGNLVLTVA